MQSNLNPSPNNIPSGISPSVPPAPARRIAYTADRADFLLAVILLAETLFMVAAGAWGGFQAGFSAAFALLFGTISLYLARKGTRIGAFAAACGVLSAGLCAVFVCTTGTLIRLLTLCCLGVTATVWFAALAGKPVLPGELGLAARVLRQAGKSLSRMPAAVSCLFRAENPRVKKASKAALGAVCAAPVLCAVIVLLVRSDAAFEGLISHLFSDVGRTAAQILVTLCIYPFALAFAFSLRKDADAPAVTAERKGLDTGFLAAFLGILNICYVVYLAAQAAYFFSAFSGILPDGYTFTYAAYARRGFFELCGVAGINLSVLYGMLLLARKNNGRLPMLLRLSGTFTALFTLVLICTAQAKMILYIREYGVTVARLGTSACMILMAVIFLTLILRFFLPHVRVLPVAVLCGAILLLLLGAGNMQSFAARYNYNAYHSGKLSIIDTMYLAQLGDEGVPYLLALTQDSDPAVREGACGGLVMSIQRLYVGTWEMIPDPQDENAADIPIRSYLVPESKKFGALPYWSLPRMRAYKALDNLLAQQPDFTRDHEPAWEDLWM